jgi:hypothetical protein
MSALNIELSGNRTTFEPGEEIAGKAVWSLDHPPRAVVLRLFWFTSGRGDEDVGLVETLRFDHPLIDESRSFRFHLPEAPYSFTGKLISLNWALELVAEPSKKVARQEITLAPGGEAVHLESLPDSKPKKRFFSRS